jgi:hypothetical protein
LKAEALATGDWSRVEKREREIARKEKQAARVAFCKAQNKILVIERRGALEQWYCVSRGFLSDLSN